jgi:putative CocE/NonD family hydrolase
MSNPTITVIENEWIPLPDGRRLSARIWLPKDASKNPVPAILEYLPYRKRDGTAPRDESTYPSFAKAGYAGVRVDLSGTGESDGDYDDEYSPRELTDACDVIEWISKQTWCSGKLGMMGISWGGFNSLQVAALRPPALKAIISIGSTVDRYNDDIHYKGGCLLYSNFSWSSTMLCYASRPPDPELVGDNWKETWLHRLNTQPFPLETWLKHQHKDDYWKHGSASENYAAIETPTLIISGWCDGYVNAPPTAAANFSAVTKAVNGPWIHKYPHFAWPKPRMDFISEAIQWWDCWLKGINNKASQLPAYRAYISENVRPTLRRETEQGRWVAENQMPSTDITLKHYFLGPFQQLLDIPIEIPNDIQQISICSPLDCGTASGEIFTLKPEGELPGDQRIDDAGSLVFDTETLTQSVEILGRIKLRLNVAIDKPLGNIIVRLNDIHTDDVINRVTWGVLNLAHRKSNENPKPMVPGQFETVEFELDECGYRFLTGHKIRIAISNHYWPMILPSSELTSTLIKLGPDSSLIFPIRLGNDSIEVAEPENQNPLPEYKNHRPAETKRWIERNIQTGETHYKVIEDTGETEMPSHGLCTRHREQSCWSITADDPLSYSATSHYVCWMHRGDWSIRTESDSSFSCDATNFYIKATVAAYESGKQVNLRHWEKVIKRQLV